MRKNALQIVTLAFCVVLLIVTIGQGRKLEEYRSQLSSEMTNKYSMLYNELLSVSNRIERKLEEDSRLVEDYALEPIGLDRISRSLLAETSVTLKEWYEDTEVTLLVTVQEEEKRLPMTADGNGVFTGQMSLPVEEECEIWLNVSVSGGGLTRREELGSWSDISMLLPVQMHSWGGSVPVYKDGVLSISSQEGDLEMRDGSPLKVSNVCYRLYVNGELVIEEPECWDWVHACAEGDAVRMTLFCRDEYGLGYEFTLDEFVCDEDASDHGTGFTSSNGTASPVLSWD